MWTALDVERLPVGCKVLIVGDTRAGKTTLLRDMLYKRREKFSDGEALIGGRTRDVDFLPPHRVQLVADGTPHIMHASVWIGEEVGPTVLKSEPFSELLASKSEVYVTARCVHCIPLEIRDKFQLVIILAENYACLCMFGDRMHMYRAAKQTPAFMIRRAHL
jgi:GTPase SAR1 family protein